MVRHVRHVVLILDMAKLTSIYWCINLSHIIILPLIIYINERVVTHGVFQYFD